MILWPLAERGSSCELYPIALPAAALSTSIPGSVLTNVVQGTQPANFGWLSWGGSPGESVLVTSLTPPGNASTFVNPDNVSDRQVSVGDWIRGKPGVSNSEEVRAALEALKNAEIAVPVWDETRGEGEHAAYRVLAFARVRLLDYHLPQQNRMTAQFLGYVECGTQNLAPMVSAGPDLSISLPAWATLNGSVTDDGLPAGASVTQFWSRIMGPGPVTFADSNAPVTLASFPLPGTYVLRLTATDSELIGSDEITVGVDRENHPPVAFSQSVTNDEDSAIAIVLQSSDPDGDALTNIIVSPPSFGALMGAPPNLIYQPNAHYNGPDSFSFKANDGMLDSAPATVTITNRPVNDPPVADAQTVGVLEDDEVQITLSGSDVEGNPLTCTVLTFPTNGVLLPTATNFIYRPHLNYHGSDGFTFKANDGLLDSLPAAVSITVTSINDAPIVFAGADQLISLTDSLTLNGAVADDGTPSDALLLISWTVVSGPGTVTLPHPGSPATTAQFSAVGVYVLRLTASDSELTGSDEVTVTVLKPNEPPMVSPGKDQLVVLPDAAKLSGAVSDDGLPAGAPLTCIWSKAGGPGTVAFADPFALSTRATFSEAGNYILRLTASDSELGSFADVRIAVRTPAMNEPPVVKAGPDKTVGFTNAVALGGTVTDDGLPKGAVLAATWASLSGPGAVTFDNSGVTNARARFSELGTYVLRLTASDSDFTACDDVIVTVYPFNHPPLVDAGADQTVVVPDPAALLPGSSVPTNGNVSLSVSLSSTAHWNNQIGQPGLNAPILWHGLAVSGTNAYAAGTFTQAGGAQVNYVARWDGQAWFPLYDPRPSSPTNPASPPIGFAAVGNCQNVVARGNEVFVRGGFKDLDGDGHTEGSARWNGTGWESWHLIFTNGIISGAGCLAISSNAVYQGGDWGFITNNSVDGLPVASYGVAKWTGTRWEALGRGVENGLVRALAIAPNGDVYAAGTFSFVAANGVANNIARFDGTNWYALGEGLTGCSRFACRTEIHALAVSETGEVYAGGDFTTAGAISSKFLATWDGTDWRPLGIGVDGAVHSISTFGPNVFVGGAFNQAGGSNARHLARWNGEFWSPAGVGSTNGVSLTPYALALSPDGMFVGGDFLEAGGLPASRIALWEFPVAPARGALLVGHATDDGLPTDSTLSFLWTQVSGPGLVTFSNPSNATTRASFSAAGSYVLRLTASDSDLTGFDDVTIVVRGNEPPEVFAGPDRTIGLTESVNLTGAVNDDGLPEGAGLPASWSVVHGPASGAVTFANPRETNTAARFSAQGVYVLRLTANDSQFSASDDVIITVTKANQPPTAFANNASAVTLPGGLLLHGVVADDGLPAGVTNCFWTQLSGPDAVTFTNANRPVTVAKFTTAGTYVLRITGSDSELTSFQDRTITVVGSNLPPIIGGSGNQPPLAAAGPDRTVLAEVSVILEGVAADDGLPAGSVLRWQWCAVSGPDRVYFADTREPGTMASFNAPGTYVLRFEVNDGELTAYDDVTFTVVPPTNEPPLVFAGFDLEVVRPDAAELFGLVLDDGLPTGYPLVSTWSKFSGPGNVTLVPPSTTNAQPMALATFSAPGTYVLRLTASDSQLTGFDDLVVTVQEGTNRPPVVNAGPDIAIALPNSAILQSNTSDDGLPDGFVEVTWSQVSGPGNVSFSTLNGVYRASFSAPGDYVLRLSANDTDLTGSDELTVTVYDEPNAPNVSILSPLDGATITAPTLVTGSVTSRILQSWTLRYRLKPPEPSESDSPLPGGEGQGEGEPWIILATGSTETNAATALATFDPTLLLNGIYELQLTATDLVGRTSTTEPVALIADGEMKVGHFTISFDDLTIPVAGLPLRVVRSYDSRNKSSGDFGVGWTLDFKNVRLQKNRHLGRAWDQSSTEGLFPTYCIATSKPRLVTITFPDGRVQKFQMVPAPFCQALSPLIYPDATFLPLANTRGTLTPLFEPDGGIVADEQLVWSGDVPGRGDFISYERLLNPPPGSADNILFNPDLFEFTSPDGYRYVVSETSGLRSVTDPNGNRLLVTTNGLTWTNEITGGASLSVLFQRDELGRITNIVDAVGHAMSYRYDTNGNLVAFIDRDGNTNGFTYDGRHQLLTLSDGRGIRTIENTYDETGRLLQTTDASGNSIGYFHDLANRLEFVTNRLGFVTVSEYDDRGNLLRVTDPLGVVSAYSYDDNDNLLTKTNVNGCACAASYAYDERDRIVSETDHRGNTTAYTYNALGKVLTLTEPSGFSTTNRYDANGNLLSTRDAASQVATFAYNGAGKVIAMTDSQGTTRFAYNEFGFLTNEINALGHTTEYTVDANGNKLSQTATWSQVSAMQLARARRRAAGWIEASTAPTPMAVGVETNVIRLVMRHEYTPSGLPLRTLYYDGSSTETHYNSSSQKSSVTDQLGRTTSYQYNNQGLVELVTYPDGCSESFDYDAEGRLISSIDRRGFETRFEYDPRGKLVRTVFPDGSEIRASYYADGSLHSETAKNGEVTSYVIDADGNRTVVSNSVGVTRFTYNYKKFATSKTDSLGRTNLYEYDALGRNTRIVYPDGTSRSATFSGKRLSSETDPSGRTTSYAHDALGRLIAATDPAGAVTQFTYDDLGNKRSETDPLGRTTFFEYDSMRRRTRTVFPDGASESTEYDPGGRVVARTDQDGNVTRFAYDAADNVIAVTNALGGVTKYTYDCGGNKLSHTDPDGKTTHFEYDRLSRLTRMLLPCGASKRTTYDTAGRVATRTDANGNTMAFGYDPRDNLTSAVDSLDRTVSFTYDAAGNRRTYTDAKGQTTAFEYDPLDRRIRTIYPDTTSEAFSYDEAGRLVAHTDQQGKTSTFQHDAAGRLSAVRDPPGRVTRYGYDTSGNRIAETNANNFVTRYEYDELGRRTRTIYPDGSTMTFAYDRFGRRVSETDAAGRATLFAYDELGRLTARQDPLGNITRFGYDAVGRLASQTDANNQTTTFDYDCLGRRSRIVRPDGTSESAVHDAVGRRLSETDANGHSASFAYDPSGRLLAITDAVGQVTQFGYDALDRLVSRTDALGRVTTFEYDALGRRTRTLHPDGAAETAGYDAKGRRIRETDPAGHSTFYAYDDSDRLIAVTNTLNQVTLFGYDAAGRLVAQTDALGRITTFEYDALDRPTRAVYSDGTARETAYDILGRRISETDQAGVTTTHGHDALGRLTAVSNALGEATLYGYDPLGRLTALTNANGHVTTFAYDALGRRVRRTLPGGQTETYAYDATGNLIRRTDFNGRTTSYAYDALNRLTARIPDAPLQAAGSAPVAFAYDALGRRTNMVDGSGSTEYRYDVRNRLVEKIKSWAALALTSTLLYGYDANRNVASIRSSHPNGTDVAYAHDALNRLSIANESRLGLTTHDYDPVGNLRSVTRPNRLQSFFQYDALDRLTSLAVSRDSTPIANYEYTVGPAGHRRAATETLLLDPALTNGGNQSIALNRAYTYDAAYRLTTETVQPGNGTAPASLTYTYDKAGNRLTRNSELETLTSQSFAYDANDRLLSDRYDANGNTANAFITTAPTGRTNEVFDQFDFEDRLLERTAILHDQPSTLNLVYDGDGHRVAKNVVTGTNTFTTLYLVDDLNPTGYPQVLEELTSANGEGFAVTRVYTWGHALLNQDQFVGDQWTTSFPGQDGHGSVRFLTDTNGAVTDTFDYDAFGNLIARRGSTPNHYLFAGEQFDPDLSLYYLRARYSEPDRGRFWTPDSFEGFASDPASLHRYTFNRNDPVNRIDPSGHISLAETFAVSTLAPLVRGMVVDLFNGVNNYSYGLAGGDALKFSTREEAYFIDSLAVGPGWKFGKPNFWAATRGAPFLLSHNPNIWHSKKVCWYECIPFDLDAPVYGPSARFPMFEIEPGELLQELTDWKHGSLLGATLHGISEAYQRSGDAAFVPWLPRGAQWVPNFANHVASSVAGLLEASVSPQTYVDGWRHVNERAYQTMLREFESGGAGPWVFAQGLSTAAGDVLGYNSLLEASFGVDRWGLAQFGATERWTRGFAGLSQIAGTMAGGLRLYNPRIGGARLGAASLADAPSTAVLSPEAKLCLEPRLRDPGLRPRLLAAIEESKLARQASHFDEFAARTQTATQLEFGFVDEFGVATAADKAAFWSGRKGVNRAAAEASGLTTLEKTPAGMALESQDLFSKLPYSEAIKPWEALSEQFAFEAHGAVNAWTGGASPVSVWTRIELPTLLRNPRVRKVIIRDATQPWNTKIIYK